MRRLLFSFALGALLLSVGTGVTQAAGCAVATQRGFATARVQPGDYCTGTLSLTDGEVARNRRAQLYVFDGRRGQCVRIDMRSTQIDPFITLLRGPSLDQLAMVGEDDDGGGNRDARLQVRLQHDDTYWIVATTAAPSARPTQGGYSLELQSC
jgi:hypothetical protein